jgi:hypothetical protein
MQSCQWSSIIIAEKLLNTKPVRSVSYAEYLREKESFSLSPDCGVTDNDSAFFQEQSTKALSTNLLVNRIEPSAQNNSSCNKILSNLNEDSNFDAGSEIPEWLKKDIEEADRIDELKQKLENKNQLNDAKSPEEFKV